MIIVPQARKTVFVFFLLFALLAISPLLSAQLLWKVSGNGLNVPSYIYGTIHVGDKRVTSLFYQKASVYFQKTNALIAELIVRPELSSSMMNHVFIEGDSTLKDLLNEVQFQFVLNHISEKLGPAAPFANRIKPLFLSMMLHEELATSEQQPPFDVFLQKVAIAEGKKVVGLESFDEQIAAFNTIPLQWQAQQLYKELAETDLAESSDELIRLYLAEDIKAILANAIEGLPKEAAQQLIAVRNRRMAARMLNQLYLQKSFVAIGAAHLYGQNGIIALLKKEGFKVKPM